MWDTLIATLIAAAITGPLGFFLKARLTRDRYLADTPMHPGPRGYDFVRGDWYLYHFTGDTKITTDPVLVSSKLHLEIDKNLVVTGSETVQVNHRRSLDYKLRGEARSGQLYFTCICFQDSSEAYSGMFSNLLDDEATGLIIARDYDRNLYSSPALISKIRKSPEVAISSLRSTGVRFYSHGVAIDEVVRAPVSAAQPAAPGDASQATRP